MVGGVEILAHHRADTFGERTTIAKALGHGILALERKLFRRTGDLKMQFTTQTKQHLLGLLELLQVDGRQETRSREAGRADAIAGRARNPDTSLDIAESTDAVLKVRLLQVGAAAGLFATLTLRLHDGTGERLPGLTRK